MAQPLPMLTRDSKVNSTRAPGMSVALASMTFLLFIWGFITCLNDMLIPRFKEVFELNYMQAMFIQFSFFSAYFIVSIPAGHFVKRMGYQSGIVAGLVTAGLGCLLFYPATLALSYPIFLCALFVLAAGITILQVAANPYITLLGPEKTSASRLTLTQAFNSLGTTIAPYIGGLYILNDVASSLVEANHLQPVQLHYLFLAGLLLLGAIGFSYLKLPKFDHQVKASEDKAQVSLWQYPHLVMGAMAIFVYVGAEVAIGSFLIIFLAEPHIADLSHAAGAKYLSVYWGGAMIGRFVGAMLLRQVPSKKALLTNALLSCGLLLLVILSDGWVAMWALLLVGLCNSIMFPTIYSLALSGLGRQTARGSAILCLAIVGGAIVPVMQGALADVIGIQFAFVLPLFCYLFVGYYACGGGHQFHPVKGQSNTN